MMLFHRCWSSLLMVDVPRWTSLSAGFCSSSASSSSYCRRRSRCSTCRRLRRRYAARRSCDCLSSRPGSAPRSPNQLQSEAAPSSSCSSSEAPASSSSSSASGTVCDCSEECALTKEDFEFFRARFSAVLRWDGHRECPWDERRRHRCNMTVELPPASSAPSESHSSSAGGARRSSLKVMRESWKFTGGRKSRVRGWPLRMPTVVARFMAVNVGSTSAVAAMPGHALRAPSLNMSSQPRSSKSGGSTSVDGQAEEQPLEQPKLPLLADSRESAVGLRSPPNASGSATSSCRPGQPSR
mmetsp:Transcript_43947/g.136127  ORF Transcript_43947/g.136127 Transcript_43947/m.136127 type:complete len:297 (-) Transcript_43947:32-922(-)